MKLSFTKMHGLGNDFVVLDFTREQVPLSPELAARIADRHFGVGCDQILIVESPESDNIDFNYRILNADGSEVGQCGNGARCFARFVTDKGLTSSNPIRVLTKSGEMSLSLVPNSDDVVVNMGVPEFSPAEIPLNEDEEAEQYSINKDGDAIHFFAVSMGNPHAVIKVENIERAPVNLVGPMLESHPIFPEKANVGFMQIHSPNEVSLRVFERGVGETLACGSGACAAAASGIKAGLLRSPVQVSLPGGTLSVEWGGPGQPVLMTGAARTVFDGEIEIDDL